MTYSLPVNDVASRDVRWPRFGARAARRVSVGARSYKSPLLARRRRPVIGSRRETRSHGMSGFARSVASLIHREQAADHILGFI